MQFQPSNDVRYVQRAPDSRLARWVSGLWLQEAPASAASPVPTRILPDGSGDLVLEYGDPFVGVEDGRDVALPRQLFSGPRTRPMLVRATGRTGLAIVRFLPFGASALFGPLHEIVDGGVELSALVGDGRARRLADELDGSAGDQRLDVLERFLLERIPASGPDPRVALAVGLLQRSRGAASIETLATHIGTSRRHLGRLFREETGLAPKTFARVLRFQNATAMRRAGHAWCSVAAACGYSDQPHLSREVRSLTGVTLRTLDRRLSECSLGRRFNGLTPERSIATLYL